MSQKNEDKTTIELFAKRQLRLRVPKHAKKFPPNMAQPCQIRPKKADVLGFHQQVWRKNSDQS